MKKLHPDKGLRIYDVKWEVSTAGPSPNNNKRIEVFLLGCDKAMKGNPCKDCFNSTTWDKSIAEFSRDPIEVADMINKGCDPEHKYITIGGGEPTDQLDALLPFVIRLKEHGFHILMYTWRKLKEVMAMPSIDLNSIDMANPSSLFVLEKPILATKLRKILTNIDILVDGEYIKEEMLLSFNSSNTARNFVGSGNQIVWDLQSAVYYGYALKDIVNLYLFKQDKYDEVNVLYYETVDNAEMHSC